jgi:hypothetical protein
MKRSIERTYDSPKEESFGLSRRVRERLDEVFRNGVLEPLARSNLTETESETQPQR